jgi:hypothetical protein
MQYEYNHEPEQKRKHNIYFNIKKGMYMDTDRDLDTDTDMCMEHGHSKNNF